MSGVSDEATGLEAQVLTAQRTDHVTSHYAQKRLKDNILLGYSKVRGCRRLNEQAVKSDIYNQSIGRYILTPQDNA